MFKTIKKYWNKKLEDTRYEVKYEKSLREIEDLKNQIKVLKRKLNDDYKSNVILNLQKDLKKQKQINKNLREDNIKLIEKSTKR